MSQTWKGSSTLSITVPKTIDHDNAKGCGNPQPFFFPLIKTLNIR